jgi:hypothetical protein
MNKKHYLLAVLFFTLAVSANSQTTGAAVSAVSSSSALNDIEVISPYSGWWRNKDKNSSSDITIDKEQIDGKEQYVLTIEVNVAPNGWANALTDKGFIIQNLKDANGVRFKALGDGKKWKVMFFTSDVTDGCFHGTIITTQKGKVTSHDIPFSRVKQPDWGKRVKFNKDNITGLGIERSGDMETGKGIIKVFDFELYTEATAAAPVANIPQGPSEHDMIVLINGTILDAEVEEISPTQIKYRRVDNLTGPVFVVNSGEVYSVKYKNGSMDIINATGKSPNAPIMDPTKLYTGISFEPSGFISGGPSVTLEFSKGSLITSFHVNFPTLALNSISEGFGFGAGVGLNYYWGGRIGGIFAGAVFEWNMFPYSIGIDEETNSHSVNLALEGGYKFVLKNGFYFRTGIAAGMTLSTYFPSAFYYKPDIATGYMF